MIAVPDAEKHCPLHGEKAVIDYERSEVLHYEPAKFWVEQFCREKRVCVPCGDQISVAPPADKIADGGIAGPGLVADLVIGKYRDHLPLNRQLSRYARLGVKLASSTVGDWVAQGPTCSSRSRSSRRSSCSSRSSCRRTTRG
ncbi:MAG: transposase [Sandaracinaceae bacterium]|nr:transposase [Sandaracinaceae bacterium]